MHRSRLANEDVSEAFDEWEDRKLQREKWGRDLKHELSESNKLMEVEVCGAPLPQFISCKNSILHC